uniref:Myb_Cef domain-containing protein n=1 Tax=Hydatigena taeniaeformis TaxID=6205 RepID=A0A0R3WNT3_HYDTA
LIKKEMLTMLHYDSLHNPPPTLLAELSRNADGKLLSAMAQKKRLQQVNTAHETYLRDSPYEEFSDDSLAQAAAAIEAETAVVRSAMGHGEVSGEAYARVWEECLAQVLHLPQHHRFTRANLVPKAERVSAAERRLEMLRGLMAEEAKKAARQEKRLSILLGGYQSRAQTLIKAIQESVEQIEQSQIELTSLEHLRQQEIGAVVRRTEMLKIDVERQRSRETQLQNTYAKMARLRDDRMAEAEKIYDNTTTPPLASPRAGVEGLEDETQNDPGGWTTVQQSDGELVEERNAGAQTDPVPLPEAIQIGRRSEFSVDLDAET